ncbi:MAG: tol-pal system protein YbgF [Burkholderiaceae bacterium]|nr:tol-pal system protein YbgF [Burkholderiaceae bacterium]
MSRATLNPQRIGRAALAVILLGATLVAHAGLFNDDEARRAILDLRQRAETDRQHASDDVNQVRRSVLDLQNQIQSLNDQIAQLTGQNEELRKTVSDLQKKADDTAALVKQNAPAPVTVDGRKFNATSQETTDFKAALDAFRSGQYQQAQTAFASFIKRSPQSGYIPSALFWLGNAQFATSNYKEAVTNFRTMLSMASDDANAPQAVLSIANCQIQLKDTSGARRTLEQLIKAYPQSEAAQAGRDRLNNLK